MRRFVGPFVVLVLLAAGIPRVQAASAPACRADAFPAAAVGTVTTRALPYFVEVELTVTNRTRFDLLVEPSRFTLISEKGDPVTPAGRAQVIDALQRPSPMSVGFFGFFSIGSVGVAVGAYPLDVVIRTVDSRMLKRGTLAPEGTIKGSVFFAPAAWPAQFALSLDGLAGPSGTILPSIVLPVCRMPFVPGEPPVAARSAPQGARSIAVSARGEVGPIAIHVSNVEFTRLATSLTVEVENAADADADLFIAIGEARVTDATGTRYTVRMLPSDLPDRVPARGRARGRLVFEPLPIPPAVSAATLVVPSVRVGASSYDLSIDIRW